MTRVTKYWLERNGVTWLMNNSTKDWIGSSASSSSIDIWRWQWVSWIKKALIPGHHLNNTVSTVVHWWCNVAYLMYIVYILVYPCICVSTFACSLFCVCIAKTLVSCFETSIPLFHAFWVWVLVSSTEVHTLGLFVIFTGNSCMKASFVVFAHSTLFKK